MNTHDFRRKLTAFFSADVAGYSHLMGEDENESTHDRKGKPSQKRLLGILPFWWISLCVISICVGCNNHEEPIVAQSLNKQPGTGQAILGPLVNANVAVFLASDLNTPIYETRTSASQSLGEAGLFAIPLNLIDDDRLYLIIVTGGSDIDADDDGIVDETSTPNQGAVHLIASGWHLRQGNVKVNILTEILYQSLYYAVHAHYPESAIINQLDQYGAYLLKRDLNGNGSVDFLDIFMWDPVADRDSLTRPWHLLSSYSNAILNNEPFYQLLEKITNPILGYVSSPPPAYDLPIPDFDAVAVARDYAYVIGMYSGLTVIDIRAPESPVQVASFRMFSLGLDISDSHVFVAGPEGLYVFDVGTPQSPLLAATIPDLALTGITISGKYAYASAGESGLCVFDITEPTNPQIVGQVDTPGYAYAVAVSGTTALIADYHSGIQIIDILDPRVPYLLKTVDTIGDARWVATDGSYAYVAEWDSGMEIIDIRTVTSPVTVAHIVESCANVAVRGSLAYVASGATTLVYDVSNPSSPVRLEKIYAKRWARYASFSEDYVFVIDGGLAIIDPFTPPSFNYIIGSCATNDHPAAVYAYRDYLFELNGGYREGEHRMIQVFDVTNPENPKYIESLDGAEWNISMAFFGDYAYLAGGYLGGEDFRILDLRPPDGPAVVRGFDLCYPYARVAISEGYAFLSRDGGMMSLDLTVPDNPPVPDNLRCSPLVAGVRRLEISASSDYVCHLGAGSWLDIYDLKGPTSATQVHTLYLPKETIDISVVGKLIYALNRLSGLMIYDATEPTDPKLLSVTSAQGNSNALAISGNYAYIADGMYGATVMDIRNPYNPRIICEIETPNYAKHITVAGGYAYIADTGGGVQVIKAIED